MDKRKMCVVVMAVMAGGMLLMGQAAPGCLPVGGLPDTGQDKCYDFSGAEILCGSGYVGQDAEYATGCQPSYTDNGNGTVTDNCTGLMWQQEDDGISRTWWDQLNYCEELELSGYMDWRLPNLRELHSLVDYSRYEPAINTDYFQSTSGGFWASTTIVSHPSRSWGVSFKYGVINRERDKSYHRYARCVR